MATDFTAPDGTTVIGTSSGYDGTLGETEVAEWQKFLGNGPLGVVNDAADWRVTAVASQSVPTVEISPGQGGQQGVVNQTARPARLTIPVPAVANEIRNYFVVVAQDWRPTPGGSSQFALREAGAGSAVPLDNPSVLRNPGVQSDQVIALVQVRGGSTAVQTIVERRVSSSKTYWVFGTAPPPSLFPFGAQVVMGTTGDTLWVTRNAAGSKAFGRLATPGVSQVVVSGGVYANLTNSPRRPAFKIIGATRASIAEVVISSPVPYRLSGGAWGLFGADDNPNSTTTRWDWIVTNSTNSLTLGIDSPQGFMSDIREYGYLRFRQVPVPMSAEVFAPGTARYFLQGVRQSGNAVAAIAPGSSFRFSLAVHPAI